LAPGEINLSCICMKSWNAFELFRYNLQGTWRSTHLLDLQIEHIREGQMQILMGADELNQFSCNLMILKEICLGLILNSFNRERFFTVMQYCYISIKCKFSSCNFDFKKMVGHSLRKKKKAVAYELRKYFWHSSAEH